MLFQNSTKQVHIQPFIDYLKLEKKYSAHTILAYEKDLDSFALFVLSEYEEDNLAKVSYSLVRSWIVLLVDSGITNRSVNRKTSSLNTSLPLMSLRLIPNID